MKNNQKKILDHSVVNLYRDELISIARILFKTKKDNVSPKLTEKQIFLKTFFNHLIEIENKQKDILIAKSFLKTPRTIGRGVREISTREDYIKYHIEFYQISIVGIFDRLLHLTNFIYKIGLLDKFVTKDIIFTNTNIPEKVKTLLKNLDKEIQPIRTEQNHSKHKAKLKLPSLEPATILDFTLYLQRKNRKKLPESLLDFSQKDLIELKNDADFYYQEFLIGEQEKIKKISSMLNIEINKLLDIIELEVKKIVLATQKTS